jgi:hypothetical protein
MKQPGVGMNNQMLEDPNTAAHDQRASESGGPESRVGGTWRETPCLLTPAKKAGLEALEREFSALLRNGRAR